MVRSSSLLHADHWHHEPKEAIIQLVASRALVAWNGNCNRTFEAPPFMTPGARTLLLQRRHIQDCTSLALDERTIERHLLGFTGGKGRCASEVRSTLGVVHLSLTAIRLGRIATDHCDFVVAALEGRLQTAARLVPTTGFDGMTDKESMDLVEQVARIHLAANIRAAARKAFNRLFAPSGDTDIDNNLGRPVTVVSAARRLHRRTDVVKRVLGWEEKARQGPLRRREEASIENLGIVEDARALETRLRAIHGEGFDSWYADMVRLMRRWTRYIRRTTELMGSAANPDFNPLHLWHGPSSLPAFYLATIHAIAWTREDEDGPAPLRRGLDAARRCEPVVAPDIHVRHRQEAKGLFFLLRNMIVRDGDATVHAVARKQPRHDLGLDGLVFDEYARRSDKREPFRIPDITTMARKLDEWTRAEPFDPEAKRIRAEMRGAIFVQLRT